MRGSDNGDRSDLNVGKKREKIEGQRKKAVLRPRDSCEQGDRVVIKININGSFSGY